uniref:Uncharacterized protein n=1 Tax=Arundo donax TaxID=35708 RepID=A0A0A9GVS2_ARUDO
MSWSDLLMLLTSLLMIQYVTIHRLPFIHVLFHFNKCCLKFLALVAC